MTRILWAMVVVSLLYSLTQAWNRYVAEQSNREVEIALDYDSFLDLCRKEGLSPESTLRRFRDLGVASIAPSETTLEKLHQDGKIIWIPGSQEVLTKDKNLQDWLSRSFSALFGKGEFQVLPAGFLMRGKWDDLTQAGLGIYPDPLKPLVDLGFLMDPRITNRDEMDLNRTNYILENIASLPKVSTVIFSGLRNEVLGYDHEIPRVAEFLRDRKIRFGYVEAYEATRNLKGSRELAEKMPDFVVKVQSLNFPPFVRVDEGKAVDTFLLGVRERHVRIVYFHPFLVNAGGVSLLDQNLNFLRQMKASLNKSGFILGPARPLAAMHPSPWGIWICGLGILAATFLLALLYVDVSVGLILGSAAVFSFLFLASLRLGGFELIRFALAFWAANLSPILGLVLFFPRRPARFFPSVGALTKVTSMTVAGGFVVSALLADHLTLLGIEMFRGVKLLFVIPVVAAPWLLWLRQTSPGRFQSVRQAVAKLVSPLREPLRVSHVVVLLFAGLAGLFMILRSGNVVPEGAVPEWERTVRNSLEALLVARPRFKEFLLGHPFFIAAAAVGLETRWGLFFLLIASLGQADIMDSLAHLHTPLRMTLLRTFHGFWIGILIGMFLRFLMRKK